MNLAGPSEQYGGRAIGAAACAVALPAASRKTGVYVADPGGTAIPTKPPSGFMPRSAFCRWARRPRLLFTSEGGCAHPQKGRWRHEDSGDRILLRRNGGRHRRATGGKVLTDCIASQVAAAQALRRRGAGDCIAQAHRGNLWSGRCRRLCSSGLTRQDLDAIAVTYAPGLIGAVLVGVNFAKAAAYGAGCAA